MAIEEGKSLVDVIERDIVRVKGDTLLSDIVLQMAETPYPVAVVTDDDRLRGVIVRGSVIGALAGKEVGERVYGLLPKLPLAEWVEAVVDWLTTHVEWLFNFVTSVIEPTVSFFTDVLMFFPPLVTIVIIALLAWWLSNWRIATFTLVGLLLIENLGIGNRAWRRQPSCWQPPSFPSSSECPSGFCVEKVTGRAIS